MNKPISDHGGSGVASPWEIVVNCEYISKS